MAQAVNWSSCTVRGVGVYRVRSEVPEVGEARERDLLAGGRDLHLREHEAEQ
jgi:hypothetical protein